MCSAAAVASWAGVTSVLSGMVGSSRVTGAPAGGGPSPALRALCLLVLPSCRCRPGRRPPAGGWGPREISSRAVRYPGRVRLLRLGDAPGRRGCGYAAGTMAGSAALVERSATLAATHSATSCSYIRRSSGRSRPPDRRTRSRMASFTTAARRGEPCVGDLGDTRFSVVGRRPVRYGIACGRRRGVQP